MLKDSTVAHCRDKQPPVVPVLYYVASLLIQLLANASGKVADYDPYIWAQPHKVSTLKKLPCPGCWSNLGRGWSRISEAQGI